MKALVTTSTIYWKRIEYTTAGTYTVTIPRTVSCQVIIVGGGAGGAYAYSGTASRRSYGGCGALITGTTTLNAGTYTVVVGSGSSYVSRSDGGITSSDGGDSSFNGNIAGGGKGAYAYAVFESKGSNGVGGTATVVSSGLLGTTGKTGTTSSMYGSYGGGGYTTDGQSGYFSIEYVSDSSDYTYTISTSTVKVVKDGTVYKAFNI